MGQWVATGCNGEEGRGGRKEGEGGRGGREEGEGGRKGRKREE